MLEYLMLILLGALLMGLAALALAPLLWARAARVTAERLHDDAHSAAFSQASEDVSRRYEEKLSRREQALRAEIGELEASRDKISAEASARINELEEIRGQLESEIAGRDATLLETRTALAALGGQARDLGAQAHTLAGDLAGIGERAGSLGHAATAIQDRAESLAEPPGAARATPVETAAAAPDTNTADTNTADTVASDTGADQDGRDQDTDSLTATLSERIRALREGAQA